MLVDRYGGGATREAMKRADALAAQGDMAGKVVWLRILEAIEELQSTEPTGAVHRGAFITGPLRARGHRAACVIPV